MKKKAAIYELGRYQKKTAQLQQEKERLLTERKIYQQSIEKLAQLSGYLVRKLAQKGEDKLEFSEKERLMLIKKYRLEQQGSVLRILPRPKS